MLEFTRPVIEDKKWVDECLGYAHSFNCEYNFGNVFIWKRVYDTHICHYNDFFICRWGKGKDIMYSLPIGTGDFRQAVTEIINDAHKLGITPRIYGVTAYYKELLIEAFGDKVSFEYSDSMSDYIYSVEKMATLRGKKYHGKRNHITNFKKNNPDWSFEKITKDNINDCIELHSSWINNRNDDEDEDYSFEFEAVLTAFEKYDELDFLGGILRIDGKAIAYTFGEKQCDRVFVTHFEKAPAEIQGAYPTINQEFTRNCLMDFEYVNREEDLGLEGLRKSKQSYNPEILLEKCVAVFNEQNC